MASEGLSRRRIVNTSSSNSADDDDHRQQPPSSHSSTPTPASVHHPHSHGGSAFEGGSKVAYDPRDLEANDEEEKIGGIIPRLTIMEEVLLLGLKDRQGYLSFWNDNISYALRGCILLELAFRRRIAIARDPNRSKIPLSERLVEVIDERMTGETILDEALKLMKLQEAEGKIGVNNWIDLLSGETWNVLKISFQLKQVRERLAKGLVDKGILRTEKRNFLLFDMATHPIADSRTKDILTTRISSLLTTTTSAIPNSALGKEGENARIMRTVCLVCAAYAASVLENALGRIGYDEREAAFQRCDDILSEFACWPFGSASGASSTSNGSAAARRREAARIGTGGSGFTGREPIIGLLDAARKEMRTSGPGAGDGTDLCYELIAGVLEVLSRLDSIL